MRLRTVHCNEGDESIAEANKVIVATGSAIKIDEEQIINSTGAVSLQTILVKMAVIEGGIIGFEVSSLWSRLGSEVTVIDFLGVLALY